MLIVFKSQELFLFYLYSVGFGEICLLRVGFLLANPFKFNAEPRIIEDLIRHGADISACNRSGKTALNLAKNNDKINQSKVYEKMKDLMKK